LATQRPSELCPSGAIREIPTWWTRASDPAPTTRIDRRRSTGSQATYSSTKYVADFGIDPTIAFDSAQETPKNPIYTPKSDVYSSGIMFYAIILNNWP
jgi:hypothetical protein